MGIDFFARAKLPKPVPKEDIVAQHFLRYSRMRAILKDWGYSDLALYNMGLPMINTAAPALLNVDTWSVTPATEAASTDSSVVINLHSNEDINTL